MKVDISHKGDLSRTAVAAGTLNLKPSTIIRINEGTIEKGDVFQVAEVQAMIGVKQTPLLIPYCHPIPIHNTIVSFRLNQDSVECTVSVKTIAKTGAEMEALMGVSLALNTIWDMVKYLEKDEHGQYPDTSITDIHVVKKEKKDA